MNVRKLGMEWGAAHAEAQPVEITHYGRRIVVYVSETHDLIVEAENPCVVASLRGGGLLLKVEENA